MARPKKTIQKPMNSNIPKLTDYELWEMRVQKNSAKEHRAEKHVYLKDVKLLPVQAEEFNSHVRNSKRQVFIKELNKTVKTNED